MSKINFKNYVQNNVLNKFQMRKRRISVLDNKYIIGYHIKIIKNKGILAKQNYVIKYLISY